MTTKKPHKYMGKMLLNKMEGIKLNSIIDFKIDVFRPINTEEKYLHFLN